MNNPYGVLVEGLIFAAGRSGLEYKFILEKVPQLSKSDLADIVEELKRKYPDDGTSGVVLYDYGKVLCFVTHSSIGEQIADALKRTKQKELSNALLEVLAIVAYQQPITKAEVEQIREGKNCDYAIGALSEAGLITVVGRKDTLGRPMLYGTTQLFLERFELTSLKKLPSRREVEERIRIIRTQVDDGGMLFHEREGEDLQMTDDGQSAQSYAPLLRMEEEEEPPVGAGEDGGYDDTDYDEAAADEVAEDAYGDEEEVWDDSDAE